ncbi:FtsB family cell division protein [Thiomicrospira microaerophila]|uniref:FtsB family cell division protein n=1 Tax=Thiomicrospira microaerophila TaxID=406020 RepID=UPI0005C8D580|nr:septum formation initiator family protein [Thiomicrospira microaerophila]
MKVLLIILSVLVLLSGIRLLSSDGGLAEYLSLKLRLAEVQQQLDSQQAVNDLLKKEVQDLQAGTDAIETLARQRLGMIGKNEVFIQLLEIPPSSVSAPVPDIEAISIQENPLPINPLEP